MQDIFFKKCESKQLSFCINHAFGQIMHLIVSYLEKPPVWNLMNLWNFLCIQTNDCKGNHKIMQSMAILDTVFVESQGKEGVLFIWILRLCLDLDFYERKKDKDKDTGKNLYVWVSKLYNNRIMCYLWKMSVHRCKCMGMGNSSHY